MWFCNYFISGRLFVSFWNNDIDVWLWVLIRFGINIWWGRLIILWVEI